MITQEEYDQISILIRREHKSIIEKNGNCFVEDAPQLHFTDSPEELLQRINGDIPIAKERIKNKKEDEALFGIQVAQGVFVTEDYAMHTSALAQFIIKKIPVKIKHKTIKFENFIFHCTYKELDHDGWIVDFYLSLR